MFHVLVAHDLSSRSEIALVRGARLAIERDGRLTIVHVVDGDLPAPATKARRAQAQSYLEHEVRRWLGRDKPPYRIDVVPGDPAYAIAAHAQALPADLVVAGRHCRRAFVDIFIDTTVERLLRLVRQPILVVSNSNQSPYRRVLVPVDLSEPSVAAIRFAATFLPRSSLHLLHAYKALFQYYVAVLSWTLSHRERTNLACPMNEQAKQAMSKLVETLGLVDREPKMTIRKGDPVALIEEELAWQKTDLVVIGTHARTGIAHALIGSVAEAVLRSPAVDVLVVPVSAPA